jgi:hypothetical protein
LFPIPDFSERLSLNVQHPLSVLGQKLSSLGKHDTLAQSIEEAYAKILLEAPDLGRNRRLGIVKNIRGPIETEERGYGSEGLELSEFHGSDVRSK